MLTLFHCVKAAPQDLSIPNLNGCDVLFSGLPDCCGTSCLTEHVAHQTTLGRPRKAVQLHPRMNVFTGKEKSRLSCRCQVSEPHRMLLAIKR